MVPYHLLTDAELAALLKAGDHAAFTEIYKRHWKSLYEASYSMLKDSDTSNDLIQEIFLWLWINREKHTTSAFKPYLYAAVKYKVANVIRHGKVKEEFFNRAVAGYTEMATEENSIEVNELKEIITQFTASLPDRARQIFHLSRNEFLTNKEIAEKMGISEKTVENQMNISIRKLKTSLGKMSFWSVFL